MNSFLEAIDNLKIISRDNFDYIKTKAEDLALTFFRNCNANIPQHLSDEEFETLKNLPGNCNLVIQKADKGNSVVLFEKDVYIRHIEKILDDNTKCGKVKIKKGILNFSINHERRINDYLRSVEKSGSLTTDQYKKIKAIRRRMDLDVDVDSLFTNIPLKKTINIYTNLLYNNVDVIEGIN